mmetsp:Transcript_3726/g.5264  ORF Transcript_3726/g.5264 Transcript_3726/m.5264 type:complete len:439 (+) Transcript_3726:37-1353(+)
MNHNEGDDYSEKYDGSHNFAMSNNSMPIVDDTDESGNEHASAPIDYSKDVGRKDLAMKDRGKKKENLRKGKWTKEEEQYTNKVIETFNAGILELPEHERGITLRSYLSEKLGCDPMRITKKFTGALCLGKKVYHADNFKGFNRSEIDRATHDLQLLELRFRTKLEEINRKKASAISYYAEEHRVSTPAIDAMLKQKTSGDKRKLELNSSTDVSNYLIQLNSQIMNNHQQWQQNKKSFEGSTSSHPINNNSSLSTLPSLSCDELLMAFKRSSAQQQQYIQNQEAIFADEYRKSILPILNSASYVFKNDPNQEMKTSHNIGNHPHHHNSSTSSSIPFQSSSTYTKHDQDNSPHHPPPLNTADEDTLRNHIQQSETDYNDAANSLIGFFNHIQRVGSQEDLVDYITEVQRTVDARGGQVLQTVDDSSDCSSHSERENDPYI